jgi:hypothetical protein
LRGSNRNSPYHIQCQSPLNLTNMITNDGETHLLAEQATDGID